MKIITTGRKVSLKPSFTERVETRMKKLEKFFSDSAEAQVTVTVEKAWQTVEITVRDKGFMVRAEKSDEQMEAAFDAAADVLQRRIIKNRKRLSDKLSQPISVEYDQEPLEEETYHIIREKHFVVKPQTVDEAILEMNMIGHTFFMFRNGETGEVNVVYKRKDNSYGLLIPD
ncbi:MAG: ribosome-associated translation inhibitor RaiA [Oscillospiraceae bacterium]|nr:ribosome-associated translation inhibitor RaiA [Oscillospiraceae bacterium]